MRMAVKCPFSCVNGKVYGYDGPHPGHYRRPSDVALQRLPAEWDREVGTVGAVLTIEDMLL